MLIVLFNILANANVKVSTHTPNVKSRTDDDGL